MSKEELEHEAGGNIFTSNNEETRNQVEKTRYHGQKHTSSGGMASGATETRLTDDDRYQSGSISGGDGGSSSQVSGGGSGYRSSYDYEKSFSSGASSSSQGGSGLISRPSSSRGAIAKSEWKLLENGTYIKVYHSKSTAGGAGRGSNVYGDSGNRYNTGNSDTGWVDADDGTRRRQQSSWSSWSSTSVDGGGSGVTYNTGRGEGIDSGSHDRSGDGNNSESSDSGWVTMPDGSRRREQSSWSSSSSVTTSGNTDYGYGSRSRETNQISPTATETRLSSSSSSRNRNDNTNTVFNAARGPGDYHGTMKKDELEREAGGTIFGATNTETRNQVENTRYQGRGYTNNNAYNGSGGGASYQEGSYYDQENRAKYDNGGRSRTGQSSFSSSREDTSNGGGQTLFGTGYSRSSSSSSSSSSGGSSSSLPKGQWVWDQSADNGKGKWEVFVTLS